MSSTILNAINMLNKDKHAVGNLNNWNKNMVNGGALVVDETIDNFSIVELGFGEDGERTCALLKTAGNKGYLIASVEDYMDEYGEGLGNFFNAKGERARIVVLEPRITRFDVSNFKPDNSDLAKKPIKNGQKVHWDVTDKTFIISNGDSDHARYAAAGNQFVVVKADSVVLDGQQTVRLEVVK